MRFEIQFVRENKDISNIDCDVDYVMKVFELQYKGLAVIKSLKGD